MQFFSVLLFVSAVAAIAVRQNVPPPPQCAFSCLTSTNTDGCSITDNSCLCRNSQFIAAQAACISKACTSPSDLQQADTFAQQNCLAVGVTLTATNIPTATQSAAQSATGTPTGVASASPSATSSNPSFSNSNDAVSTLSGTTPAMLLAGVAVFALAL